MPVVVTVGLVLERVTGRVGTLFPPVRGRFEGCCWVGEGGRDDVSSEGGVGDLFLRLVLFDIVQSFFLFFGRRGLLLMLLLLS